MREFCERLWQAYRPLNGDPHFLLEARSNFHARTWEMILACLLQSQGSALERPPPDGPDVKIVTDFGTVWVEAVALELGVGHNDASRVITWTDGATSGFRTQPDKTVLRYTGALHKKNLQLAEFRERGIVGDEDMFIVAINGGLLHDYSAGDPDPEVLKSVYPIGDAFASFTPYSEEAPEFGNHYRDSIEKEPGVRVPTSAFLHSRFERVSAILFSKTTAWNPQPRAADHALVIHNQTSRNKLPSGFFPFGREGLVSDGELNWYQHPRTMRLLP